MQTSISNHVIDPYRQQLENHPVYRAIETVQDLCCFMEHHVYSVWDFMSLIKYLQNTVAPARYPWYPEGDTNVKRFINELVLEEESDNIEFGGRTGATSHFELYCNAMQEIGANNQTVKAFVGKVAKEGIDKALSWPMVPGPSLIFTRKTFEFIGSGKPHVVAAALALGREHIIPCIFRSILSRISVNDQQAPSFHYYLNRHIHLDEDFHAPLSLKLLEQLCGGDPEKIQEAEDAAVEALLARIRFWDGVHAAIETLKSKPRIVA